MAHINSRFASVFEWKSWEYKKTLYLKIQRWLWNLAWRFQRIEKTYRRSTFEQLQEMTLAITDFINLNKPDHQVALHSALAEINTTGFFGRSIKCYSTKHPHKYSGESLCARKHPVLTQSCSHGIISGWSFANYSVSFHFKRNENTANVLQADFWFKLLIGRC